MASNNERNLKFVEYICKQCSSNRATAAHLRRSDLKNSDPYVMTILVKFGLDITKSSEFTPYCLVAAAIARSKKYENGKSSFIQILSSVEKEDSKSSEKDDFRVRRLLSCESLTELALIFRHIMTFVQSKSDKSINYAELLDDLCSFNYEEWRTRTKRKWAMQFYNCSREEELMEK
jgi:CRISPR type I-E-associated protein CasB/Cse2